MATRKCVPGYLLHKSRGVGKVVIHGKTHYLPGEYGSDESKAEYERQIAEYLLKKDRPETVNVTINRLCVAFLEHLQSYYVKDGSVTAEVGAIRCSLRPAVWPWTSTLVRTGQREIISPRDSGTEKRD